MWHSPLLFVFQYGFVNHAIYLLVQRNFGEETWQKIKWVLLSTSEGRIRILGCRHTVWDPPDLCLSFSHQGNFWRGEFCVCPKRKDARDTPSERENSPSLQLRQAQSTQDAGRSAGANSNVFPLMLLVCSVDTPIHINRSHLLALHCAWCPASCVDWASRHGARNESTHHSGRITLFSHSTKGHSSKVCSLTAAKNIEKDCSPTDAVNCQVIDNAIKIWRAQMGFYSSFDWLTAL